MQITRDCVLSVLIYDREKGRFLHRRSRRKFKAFDEAGTTKSNRRVVTIYGKKIFVHRLVWLMENGEFPPQGIEVDHIDRNPLNNHISNLRLATKFDNHRNLGLRRTSKSGVTGVTWNKKMRKWRAMITYNYVMRYLGGFDSFQDAVAARLKAERELFGEFAPRFKHIPTKPITSYEATP